MLALARRGKGLHILSSHRGRPASSCWTRARTAQAIACHLTAPRRRCSAPISWKTSSTIYNALSLMGSSGRLSPPQFHSPRTGPVNRKGHVGAASSPKGGRSWKPCGDVGGRGIGVVILSGDRHEFAATKFPPPPGSRWPESAVVHEYSASPPEPVLLAHSDLQTERRRGCDDQVS